MDETPASNTGICVLCQFSTTLCQSHIIPEFCYKPIYDEKHRAHAFWSDNPEQPWFEQKGTRSYLLCKKCERDVNDWYEKPFREYWIGGNALAILAAANSGILTGIPYEAFKLFHLRVLLLASVSDHSDFAEVKLGPQTNEIRRMVRDRDAGPDSRFQIACAPIRKPDGKIWRELVVTPRHVLVSGARAFHFTFCGARWFYFVEGSAPELEKYHLRDDGTMLLEAVPAMMVVKSY